VFSAAELQLIANLGIRHNCLVLLDEVYEHLVFPGGHLIDKLQSQAIAFASAVHSFVKW